MSREVAPPLRLGSPRLAEPIDALEALLPRLVLDEEGHLHSLFLLLSEQVLRGQFPRLDRRLDLAPRRGIEGQECVLRVREVRIRLHRVHGVPGIAPPSRRLHLVPYEEGDQLLDPLAVLRGDLAGLAVPRRDRMAVAVHLDLQSLLLACVHGEERHDQRRRHVGVDLVVALQVPGALAAGVVIAAELKALLDRRVLAGDAAVRQCLHHQCVEPDVEWVVGVRGEVVPEARIRAVLLLDPLQVGDAALDGGVDLRLQFGLDAGRVVRRRSRPPTATTRTSRTDVSASARMIVTSGPPG